MDRKFQVVQGVLKREKKMGSVIYSHVRACRKNVTYRDREQTFKDTKGVEKNKKGTGKQI